MPKKRRRPMSVMERGIAMAGSMVLLELLKTNADAESRAQAVRDLRRVLCDKKK